MIKVTTAKLTNASNSAAASVSNLVGGIMPESESGKSAIIFGLVVLVVILAISTMIYVWLIKPNADKLPTTQNMVNIASQQTAIVEKALDTISGKKSPMQTLSNDRNFLINHRVLATISSGYLGPSRDGVFSEQQAMKLALSAGVRCFVFDVGEMSGTARMKNYVGGMRVSLNSGHVGKALCSTEQAAFGSMIGAVQNIMETDPVIFYLRFEKPPSEKAAQDIADALYRIRGSILRSNAKGEFTHRRSENQLFFLNPEDLSKKIIVLANIDTGVYRKNISSTGRPDLDYYVHGRVYNIADNQKDVNTRYAYEIPLSYISSLDTEGVNDLMKRTRVAWSVLMPPSTEYVYTEEDIKRANECGIQAIASFVMRDVVADANALTTASKNGNKVARSPVLEVFRQGGVQGAYKPKTETQQYVRPKAVPIQAAPKEFNSNGGMLSAPSVSGV